MASITLPTRALTAALFTLLAWAANPTTTQAQLPDYLPTDGLVGWWPFNGNANDESGNGNDGMVNGATLTEDRLGNPNAAYSFDGIDDFIQVMDSPSFNFQLTNSISASYWIRQLTNSSSQLDLVLAKQIGSGDTQNGWNGGITANGLSEFRVMSGQGSVPLTMGGSPVSLNAWTLLTFVYDQGVYQTYVNGELEQSGLVDPIAVVGTSNSNLFIGKPSWVANNVRNFDGDIDDIAIYNRALTPEEIAALYTGIPYIAPCNDPTACNFEQEGECVYPEPNYDCDGNCLNEIYTGGAVQIPDVQSVCFESSLTYSAFAPGAVIESPNDLDSVYINLEHSYMGDLVIRLFCPNGQSMLLHQGGAGVYLGIPVDFDLEPSTPGVGFDYFWSPNSSNGSWVPESSGFLTLPSGTYSALGSWNDLNGCPLNGTWSLQICDVFGSDNGYLFDWSVFFADVFYPDPNFECVQPCINDADGDGVCDEFEILGCTDATACNYTAEATDDDASCIYPAEPYLGCDGNCLNDTNNNGVCDELDVPGCTFEGACNYNSQATVNDNSCFFATAVFDCNGNCQQDANNNGICDQLEAIGAQLCGEGTVWDNSVGTCIGFDPCPADLNNSGVVDVADLLIFLTFFGEICD